MSDPANPAPPDAPTAAATPVAPTASSAPPAQAPAAQPAPTARVNPWAMRPARPASAPAQASPAVPPSAPTDAPAAPAGDPRIEALMAVLGETVAQDIAALPANVQSAVKAIAGDDPVAQRKAINAMRANGIASPSPAPIPAPASTVAPIAPATPTPNPTGDDASRLAEWEKLQRIAPIMAEGYRTTHGASIDRAIKARGSN